MHKKIKILALLLSLEVDEHLQVYSADKPGRKSTCTLIDTKFQPAWV
jgi:hypothetical protein